MFLSRNKRVVNKNVTFRWGYAELFGEGYVGVPNIFLQLYTKLQPPLTSGEAMFVVHLMSHKWDDQNPFPSYKKISDKMGVSSKATQRHAANLESKGYLTRIIRYGHSNEFDLSKLFEALLETYNQLTEANPDRRRQK
jgi:hypothetical protein